MTIEELIFLRYPDTPIACASQLRARNQLRDNYRNKLLNLQEQNKLDIEYELTSAGLTQRTPQTKDSEA